ncbi:MAG TPA: IS21 family transposase, partial [Enteractinococcus sp.]
LEYYQSAAVPTDAYKPQYKGHVESGVRVVTNWVIHFLEDRRFTTLDELNDAIATQVEWINERTPFRGEPRSRRDWFEDLEREALIELPAQRWQQVDWRKAKVSRDWHVQVDTIKYSVPFGYVGRTLEVRIAGEQVAILADGQIVAEHQRGARRHSYVTDQQHAPDGYQDTSLLWTRAYFVRQANKVGPGTVQALNRLLDQKKIEAQGFRACMNILGLGKGPNRHLLERACQELCADPRTGISYTAVKHRITLLRAANNQRPTTSGTRDTADLKASSVPAPSQRDTSSAHLAGISAFSLQALTGESAASASTDQEDGNV